MLVERSTLCIGATTRDATRSCLNHSSVLTSYMCVDCGGSLSAKVPFGRIEVRSRHAILAVPAIELNSISPDASGSEVIHNSRDALITLPHASLSPFVAMVTDYCSNANALCKAEDAWQIICQMVSFCTCGRIAFFEENHGIYHCSWSLCQFSTSEVHNPGTQKKGNYCDAVGEMNSASAR